MIDHQTAEVIAWGSIAAFATGCWIFMIRMDRITGLSKRARRRRHKDMQRGR